ILSGSDVITGINYFLLLLIWVVGVANAVLLLKLCPFLNIDSMNSGHSNSEHCKYIFPGFLVSL
ncbi:MAG: hypothetical protein JXB88_17225, partial [Spirochaetales bacterium]|nr:hypothetical protein [Spirochaetales bacterium]